MTNTMFAPSYIEKVAAIAREVLNQDVNGRDNGQSSNKVRHDGIVLYLDVLKDDDFQRLWQRYVVQGRDGEALDRELRSLTAKGTRITDRLGTDEYAALKHRADKLVIAQGKTNGAWLKGVVACALAVERLGPNEAG